MAERSRADTGREAVVGTGLRPAPAPSAAEHARLLERIAELEARVRQRDEQRRAMLHILQDSHRSNLRLERARRAMIHIMGDLHEMTAEMTTMVARPSCCVSGLNRRG